MGDAASVLGGEAMFEKSELKTALPLKTGRPLPDLCPGWIDEIHPGRTGAMVCSKVCSG
jgi:hypothetical protein